MTGSLDDAEELAQDAFLRAYQRLEQENQILRGKGGPNLISAVPVLVSGF